MKHLSWSFIYLPMSFIMVTLMICTQQVVCHLFFWCVWFYIYVFHNGCIFFFDNAPSWFTTLMPADYESRAQRKTVLKMGWEKKGKIWTVSHWHFVSWPKTSQYSSQSPGFTHSNHVYATYFHHITSTHTFITYLHSENWIFCVNVTVNKSTRQVLEAVVILSFISYFVCRMQL